MELPQATACKAQDAPSEPLPQDVASKLPSLPVVVSEPLPSLPSDAPLDGVQRIDEVLEERKAQQSEVECQRHLEECKAQGDRKVRLLEECKAQEFVEERKADSAKEPAEEVASQPE